MTEVFPRRFGKYILLKSLARGGMGEIYVAATGEPGFQKFCVIKKVIAERSDKGKANRFLDEAKVVLRLAHANLVLTFDAGEVDGEFFIAMELVEGKDLREIWNRCVRTRTRIPLDVALHVVREIARALAYVHSYGDLHLGPPRRRAAQHPAQLLRRGEADRLRPGAQRAQAGAHGTRASSSGARRTWRPSRRAARWPTRAATSTAWASSCGSC